MTIRLSQKLNARIKAGPTQAQPLDNNPLADWSAHVIALPRTQYILLTHTKSLYCVLNYAKGITSVDRFLDFAFVGIGTRMTADGMGDYFQQYIAPDRTKVKFAKALDRSITGSMNDLAYQASVIVDRTPMSMLDTSGELNDIPMVGLEHIYALKELRVLAMTMRARIVASN